MPTALSNAPVGDVSLNMVYTVPALPDGVFHDIEIEFDDNVVAFTAVGAFGGSGSVDVDATAEYADVPPLFDARIL